MPEPRIEPRGVIDLVEQYVRSELSDAKKYSNRTPLDESGIWSLHQLAAKIYAFGYAQGEEAESCRRYANYDRIRDQHAAELKTALAGERASNADPS